VEREKEFTGKWQWNRHKWLISLILFVFLAVTATAGALAYWLGEVQSARVRPNSSPVISPKSEKVEEAERFITLPNKLNIMLLGVDERPKEGDPGRSDTLLVMMVDTLTREVSLVSVPRDTRVRIKGLGWDKINHAFAAGGAALTQQTTENFLGIPIDYYAKVDLQSFGRVVDAMGGVTIDVEERMQYEDTWDNFVIDLKPGLQRLDGRTALQYVRYRDEEGDIGRIRRQQKFIKAVLAEMNTLAGIMKLPGIAREVFASLDTNMPMPVVMGLIHQLKGSLATGLKVHMVEGSPYYINDISYWIPDVMKISRKVAEMQGVSFSGNVQDAAQRKADEYQRNLPVNAHLDTGDYYSKIDSQQVKPIPPPTPPPLPPPPPQTPTVRTTETQTTTPITKPPPPPTQKTMTKARLPIVGQKRVP
jgi:LCP family protein required for cell wall assembly